MEKSRHSCYYNGYCWAEEFEAGKLKINPATRLLVLYRFRLADDEIISLECTFIPYALCRDIEKYYDFS